MILKSSPGEADVRHSARLRSEVYSLERGFRLDEMIYTFCVELKVFRFFLFFFIFHFLYIPGWSVAF